MDIYAILNKGFSEYEEIKEGSSSGKSSSKRGGAGVGFKIFKLGVTAEAELIKKFRKFGLQGIKVSPDHYFHVEHGGRPAVPT